MFLDSVIYIGLAQSLFAAFALATRFRVKVSDKILIACLLTFAVRFIAYALQEVHGDYMNLEFSLGLIPLTFGPYVYLYTVYLVDRKLKFDPKDLLHFLPFILLTIIYFIFFKDRLSLIDVAYFNKDVLLIPRLIIGITYFGMVIYYTIITFKKLNEFRSGLESQFSFWSQQLRLWWLNFIPFLFSLFFLLYFVSGIINALTFREIIVVSDLSQVGLTLIAFLISYFGLRQPPLFQNENIGLEEMELQLSREEASKEKKELSFSDIEIEEKVINLNRIMKEDKPYLNSVLTLYDLATKANMPRNELTNLLNKNIGKNFFSYVNEFRLNEVIKRFKNEKYKHYTIIAIAYDCGFNSKSTFNSLFKQQTGQTPSAYRKSLAD